ncbi:MAG: hypothetical protein ACJAXJ_003757 [Colwellia sp.]|jgi:hypothetical protein
MYIYIIMSYVCRIGGVCMSHLCIKVFGLDNQLHINIKNNQRLYRMPLILLFLLILLLLLRYYLIQVQVVQRLALVTSEAKKITNAFKVFSGDRIRVLNDVAILWPDRDLNLLDWFHFISFHT